MNILSANLKHLYQRRSCWLIGLFMILVTIGLVTAIIGTGKGRQGLLLAPALWVLYMGTFIAALPIDVLTKPFSYCLPGHRTVPRNFLFSIGLPLVFLWSLSILFVPGLDFIKIVPVFLAVFSVFSIFYWAGVWIVFKFKAAWPIIFAFFPLLMFGDKTFNVSNFIVKIILENPLPLILLGIVANVSAWRHWSRPDLARQYCGKLWMGLFDAWNSEKVTKLKLAKLAEKDKKKPDSIRVLPGIERFFIGEISGTGTGSLRQYIWGSLYKFFGIGLSQYRRDWLRFLIIILPLLCFLGYFGPGGNIVFFMPGLMTANMNLNVHSSLLIAGGRRERFWSALTLAAVTAAIATFLVVLAGIFTILLEPILPKLTLEGRTLIFQALNMELFFVPVLMIPITLTIRLIFHKNPMWVMLLTIMLLAAFFAFGNVRQYSFPAARMDLMLTVIITLLCLSWGMFIAVLRYITMRRCLAG